MSETSDKKFLTVPPETDKMPSGIPYIIGNEAAERFSFYGMKAILFVFMTQHLHDAKGAAAAMPDAEATAWVHNFITAAYFFPIIGAIFSDWLFGKYNTILWISILYCVGHAILALMDVPGLGIDQQTILFYGLALIAIGAGGIKPCVSAHVGDQFGAKNSHLLPIVFSWFYFSINIGAMVSMALTPYLLDEYGAGVAFGIPGALMAIATFTFWLGRHEFVHVPAAGKDFWKETFSTKGIQAIKSLLPLYLITMMFWALFDQTSSRWIAQAKLMDRDLLPGIELSLFGRTFNDVISPSQMQAVNPFIVLALIPMFALWIYPLMGRFFKVTPLKKIGIGMFMMLLAFAVPGWIQTQIDAGLEPRIHWQILAYVLITAAEVMVSITCLEFSYTQAPKEMKSVIMGLYLLSIAAGNLFTAQVNHYIAHQAEEGIIVLPGASYYWFFTACMAATAVGFVIWSQFYREVNFVEQNDVEQENDHA